jgi:hypothetical protein
MSSLKERIDLLENDLKAVPSRINVYHDLPFAILRYDPTDEWELRREVRLLATRLEQTVAFLTGWRSWRRAFTTCRCCSTRCTARPVSPRSCSIPARSKGTTGLRFMDLKDRDALGNYRVKIYG